MTKGINVFLKSAFLLVFTFLIVLSTYSAVGDTTKVRAHAAALLHTFPANVERKVVFPAPEGPMTALRCPA